MSDKISIVGLDKPTLLAALYNAATPLGLGFLHHTGEPMTREEAQRYLEGQTYFDYLKGRVMKIDLGGNQVDTWGYDRDNGQGAVQQVVNELRRNENNTNTPVIEKRHEQNMLKNAQDLGDRLYTPSTSEGNMITLGVGTEFSRLLMPIITEILGTGLSGQVLLRAIMADPAAFTQEEAEAMVEADATDVKKKAWFLVKTNPESVDAKRIAGQLVSVVDIDNKTKTVSVFTLSVLQNHGGVAIRLPLTDLTNRTDKRD